MESLGITIGPAICRQFKANVFRTHFDGDALEIFEAVNTSWYVYQLDAEVVKNTPTSIQGLCCLIP